MGLGELLAKGFRGGHEDLYFTGHIAVTDSSGKLLYYCGDPSAVTFARSSAKPMQTMVVIESGAVDAYQLTESELSTLCGSHSGEEYHEEAVLSILTKAGLSSEYLQCGLHYPLYVPRAEKMRKEGIEPNVLQENCSGKHSGMLITAKHMGESLHDYYVPSHPHQQRILHMLGEVCNYPAQKIVLGTDGCGVPVHAMPLTCFAEGYARIGRPDKLNECHRAAAERIVNAIQRYPYHMSGTGRLCVRLNEISTGRVFAKSGADGYYGLGIRPDGIGITVKIDCGLGPIRDAVVVETLRQLGEVPESDLVNFDKEINMDVFNHKKEVVGRTACCFTLHRAG